MREQGHFDHAQKGGGRGLPLFPEPDLVPLFVSEEWITEMKEKMPELPESKRQRYVELGLTPEQARTISEDIELASFLESTFKLLP